MGFLENNETMAWLNQAGGGCPCQYAGCTDPAANNYDASASVDDGSCTYPQISCYKCVGSNLVGNNFNGPSCPGGWSATPPNCTPIIRNFSGDYYNIQGNDGKPYDIRNCPCGTCPGANSCVPCDHNPCGEEAIMQDRPNRGIMPISLPRMDGRKVQAGGRLSQRISKGDTDPTDDMGFRRFDGSNRMGFDNDGMASDIWFNARGRKGRRGRGQSRLDSGGNCYYTCPNGGTVTLPCDEPVVNITAACGTQLAPADDRMNRFSGNGFTSY
tara:strand:+ start:93 stop:902 length:810 start_codon:yes stop_codon:yes gene_type:complete